LVAWSEDFHPDRRNASEIVVAVTRLGTAIYASYDDICRETIASADVEDRGGWTVVDGAGAICSCQYSPDKREDQNGSEASHGKAIVMPIIHNEVEI
jgi:hypothetical protein